MKADKDIINDSLMARIRELEQQVASRDFAIKRTSSFLELKYENHSSTKAGANLQENYINFAVEDDVEDASKFTFKFDRRECLYGNLAHDGRIKELISVEDKIGFTDDKGDHAITFIAFEKILNNHGFSSELSCDHIVIQKGALNLRLQLNHNLPFLKVTFFQINLLYEEKMEEYNQRVESVMKIIQGSSAGLTRIQTSE